MEKLKPNDVEKLEVIKDLVDQFIDLMLNYRQSGHPGGSRSKVHMFLSSLLSGYVRYDLRDPAKTFNDRIILAAGHTIPLVYSTSSKDLLCFDNTWLLVKGLHTIYILLMDAHPTHFLFQK